MTGLCSNIWRAVVVVALLSISAFGQVDINTAGVKELMGLGLNKTQALNVVKYRKAHKFKSTSELTRVHGISFTQAQNLQSKVRVGSKPPAKKTTASKKKNG